MVINTICVCGAGTMGRGIAQAAAQAGIFTVLYEVNPAVLENAKSGIAENLRMLADKQKITEEQRSRIYSMIRFSSELEDCIGEVIIEAILEKEDLKVALFNQLAEINHSETIFASNTSSLPVSSIARKVQHPERVIGMHFFNPATIMKLVEVVTTPSTNTATTNAILELARRMGKTPVVCKDAPGFIVNRVARPYYIESLRLLEEGKSGKEQLDRLLEATGFRMGPFKLMDLIGNDVNYAVSCSVYDQMNKPERLRPSFLQEANVASGKLGRKSGEGFYSYNKENNSKKDQSQ
jgi:3-hydroxybutyryl-CoA dehydrogenase